MRKKSEVRNQRQKEGKKKTVNWYRYGKRKRKERKQEGRAERQNEVGGKRNKKMCLYASG
jgi:hypothetical protein